jgi:hypothetical protein
MTRGVLEMQQYHFAVVVCLKVVYIDKRRNIHSNFDTLRFSIKTKTDKRYQELSNYLITNYMDKRHYIHTFKH